MIDNEFTVKKVIGMGGSSKVFLATTSQGEKVAIKAIRKDKNYKRLTAENMLKREHEMLEKLVDHPNIISPLGWNFDGEVVTQSGSEKVMYNVLEYAQNGAISRFIRYTGGLEEELARLFILQMANALQFIHDQEFAHLDIKLENILLDEYFNIKLADLGSWVSVKDNSGFIKNRRGTALYMAPEVSSLKPKAKFKGKAADIYSLGVTIYLLLTGEFPNTQDKEGTNVTCGSDPSDTFDWEMADDSKKLNDKYSELSEDVKLLLQNMLHPDPSERPTVSQILSYPWLWRPISESLISEAFDEMAYRKKYILDYCKHNSSAISQA